MMTTMAVGFAHRNYCPFNRKTGSRYSERTQRDTFPLQDEMWFAQSTKASVATYRRLDCR
jgi:hypothetical protein